MKGGELSFEGGNFLRQRLVLSTISGKPFKVSRIREKAGSGTAVGLKDYEVSLLRLFQKVTDGSDVWISSTGTALKYKPGVIFGGEEILHDCGVERNVVYFLEALLLIAPFGKAPLAVTLKGVTEDGVDDSIDTFRTVCIPLLRRAGISEGVKIQIKSRGCRPDGGGEVIFSCPIIPKIAPIQVLNVGRVKRVRGVAYSCGVSTQFPTRSINRVRAILNELLPDVWIYVDPAKGDKAGKSKGYGVSLVAETIKGCHLGADTCLNEENRVDWEELARRGRADVGAADSGATVDAVASRALGNTRITRLLQTKESAEEARKRWKSTADEGEMAENGPAPMLGRVEASDNVHMPFTEAECLAHAVSSRLLAEVAHGGVVGTSHQHILLYFMALTDETAVSKARMGPLTPHTIQFMRHIKDFLGVTFNVTEESAKDFAQAEEIDQEQDRKETEKENGEEQPATMTSTVLVKCVGVAYRNIARKTF